MDERSSRLLIGRRVFIRHSARFISRSALAIAIPHPSFAPRSLNLPLPAARGQSRGPRPAAGALTSGGATSRDKETAVAPGRDLSLPVADRTRDSDRDQVADEDQR